MWLPRLQEAWQVKAAASLDLLPAWACCQLGCAAGSDRCAAAAFLTALGPSSALAPGDKLRVLHSPPCQCFRSPCVQVHTIVPTEQGAQLLLLGHRRIEQTGLVERDPLRVGITHLKEQVG